MYLHAANKQTTQWTPTALTEWKTKHAREAGQWELGTWVPGYPGKEAAGMLGQWLPGR